MAVGVVVDEAPETLGEDAPLGPDSERVVEESFFARVSTAASKATVAQEEFAFCC